jgi:hypothetical protein
MNTGSFRSPARRWLSVVVVGSALVLMPRPSRAQTAPLTSYLRLQRLAEELDDLAQQARADARVAPDRVLDKMIDRFAGRTREFRERIENQRMSAKGAGAEVRRLIGDASTLQRDVEGTAGRNAYLYGDWTSIMAVMTRINGEYRADLGLAAFPARAVGTTGAFPSAVARDDQPLVTSDPAEFRALADQLDQRAARAARQSNGSSYDDLLPQIEMFAQGASFLDREFGQLTVRDVRTTIDNLLQTAVETENDLQHRHVAPEVRDNWARIVDLLTSLRDLARQGVTSSPGAVVPPAVDRNSYLTEPNNPATLLADLDNRVAHATQLAARAGNDDVTAPAARLTEQLRDYEHRYSDQPLSEGGRRALDGLIKDAQATQRDFARRGVPGNLLTAWNGIVNELVRLRDGR